MSTSLSTLFSASTSKNMSVNKALLLSFALASSLFPTCVEARWRRYEDEDERQTRIWAICISFFLVMVIFISVFMCLRCCAHRRDDEDEYYYRQNVYQQPAVYQTVPAQPVVYQQSAPAVVQVQQPVMQQPVVQQRTTQTTTTTQPSGPMLY
jgi:heme/copper-type cytochrome/quinol oxidase subunit 2